MRKHAQPRTITVRIAERAGMLESEVADDGCGFDVEDVRSRPGAALHLGLDSMAERVRAAGGEVTIDSEPGAGRGCASPSRPASSLRGSRPAPKGWWRLPRKRGVRLRRFAGTFGVVPPITRV